MKNTIKKNPAHSHHHSALAIFLGLSAIFLSLTLKNSIEISSGQTTDIESYTQTTRINPAVNCSYETGEWSDCSSGGYQTRTVTKNPSSCQVANDYPQTKRTCTYTSPQCSYVFSDWSACSSSGYRTRMIVSKNPSGCVSNENPALKERCEYTAPSNTSNRIACTYAYSVWGNCNSSGRQTRTVTSKTPNNCYDSAVPVLEQSCAYANLRENIQVACSYNLSDWSSCGPTGKQKRTLIAKTPINCFGSESPELEKPCVYTDNTENKPTINPSSETSASESAVAKTQRKTSAETENLNITPSFNFLNLSGGEVINGELKIQGTVSDANSVEFYLIQADSNNPKYLGLAKKSRENVWEYKLDSVSQPNGTYHIRPKIKNSFGSYEGNKRLIIILNTDQLSQTTISNNDSEETSSKDENENKNQETTQKREPNNAWKKQHFQTEDCQEEKICGNEADPDLDGLTNAEEYRLTTNPTSPDTDQDGFLDGDEIINRFNPTLPSPGDKRDKMVFESPKDSGEIKKEIYKIDAVEMIQVQDKKKNLKLSGKALPSTYITLYIYSDPIVLTVKTDKDGNWSYILDKEIEDGNHEVYVAVTDNTGKITAKSEPIAFVKTAEAASIINSAEASASERAISPTKAWSENRLPFFLAIGLGALALAVAVLGLIKNQLNSKIEETDL